MYRLRPLWVLGALLAWQGAAAAVITIVNMDAAGEGLNDPESFTPIGGNNATTLGQARLNVLNEAARIWGQQISSPINIVVEAQFDSLACSFTTATLGSAGPLTFFTGGTLPLPNVLYPAALADALTGLNVNNRNDISAKFNSSIWGNANCLNGRYFYLGYDHQLTGHGDGRLYTDLLNVVLHEFGHGLGFVSIVNQDGTSLDTSGGRLSVFDQYVYSEANAGFWPQLTSQQRAASATSNGQLVWNAAAVNGQLSGMLSGLSTGSHLRLYAPTTWDDGSSVSHWDIAAFPNLLMEPFLTANPNGLTDLTGCALRDMGWPGTRCPDTTGANTPPVAMGQAVNAIEDTAVQLLLLGTDADGSGALTYSIVSGPSRGALFATSPTTSNSGVTYIYTPAANLNGADSFTFQVNDGTEWSNLATVTIDVAAVNDAPVASPQSVVTQSGVAVTITLSGSDVENDALTYHVLSNPASGTLSGTASNLTYTPNAGFSGADSFTFRVNDGALDSAPATVSISVIAPVTASSGTGSAAGGGGGATDATALLLLALLLMARDDRLRRRLVFRRRDTARGPGRR